MPSPTLPGGLIPISRGLPGGSPGISPSFSQRNHPSGFTRLQALLPHGCSKALPTRCSARRMAPSEKQPPKQKPTQGRASGAAAQGGQKLGELPCAVRFACPFSPETGSRFLFRGLFFHCGSPPAAAPARSTPQKIGAAKAATVFIVPPAGGLVFACICSPPAWFQ